MSVSWQQWEPFRDDLLSEGGVQRLASQYDCLIGGLELTQDFGVLDEEILDEDGRFAISLMERASSNPGIC